VLYSYCALLDLLSFPTRRSSDLDFSDRGVGSCPSWERMRIRIFRTWKLLWAGRAVGTGSYGPQGLRIFAAGSFFFHSIRPAISRSEEHTSELQSRENLVCRLLLE